MPAVPYIAAAAVGYTMARSASGPNPNTTTSDPSVGYQWQDWWRTQDREILEYEKKQERAVNAQDYYTQLINYREQFVLRYGASRPQQLQELDKMIEGSYREYLSANDDAVTDHWNNTVTGDFPSFGTTMQKIALSQPTGTGIMGAYSDINQRLLDVKSDFSAALTEHAASRAESDLAFEGRLGDSLNALRGKVASSISNLTGRLTDADQQLISTLQTSTDKFTSSTQSAVDAMKQALGGSLETYQQGVAGATSAITEQQDFYRTLIQDPGLASDQVRNLLTQSERDLTGQVQNIKDYYSRIGRSGSGEERAAIEDLRQSLARSFAENIAFTSDYGRQQTVALELEKAGLSKEEAAFAAQIAGAQYGAETQGYKDIFAAESDTAGTIRSARTDTAKTLSTAEMGGAQTLFGAESDVAKSILGARTATSEANLQGAEFGAGLDTQLIEQMQSILGTQTQLGASLTLPSMKGDSLEYNPTAYGSVTPYKTGVEYPKEESLDLEGLGKMLAMASA